jgi:predicted glutamine amidotransferase
MCRLFGFRSVLTSKVHSSLVSADNALIGQSEVHPHGWGVAYYLEQTPHVIKSTEKAMDCNIFQRVSGVVSSQTVIAHIRNATQGELSILNSHPFQYGDWTFAHNGNIKDFDKIKSEVIKRIDPELQRYILGSTDSEHVFFFMLSKIKQHFSLKRNLIPMGDLFHILDHAIKELVSLSGDLSSHDKPIPTENYLTFVLSNGYLMLAFEGGQPLHLCTYKKECPERDTCPKFAPMCEAPPAKDGKVNHFIVSSEPLAGQNVWQKLDSGSLVGIDHDMQLHRQTVQLNFLK